MQGLSEGYQMNILKTYIKKKRKLLTEDIVDLLMIEDGEECDIWFKRINMTDKVSP